MEEKEITYQIKWNDIAFKVKECKTKPDIDKEETYTIDCEYIRDLKMSSFKVANYRSLQMRNKNNIYIFYGDDGCNLNMGEFSGTLYCWDAKFEFTEGLIDTYSLLNLVDVQIQKKKQPHLRESYKTYVKEKFGYEMTPYSKVDFRRERDRVLYSALDVLFIGKKPNPSDHNKKYNIYLYNLSKDLGFKFKKEYAKSSRKQRKFFEALSHEGVKEIMRLNLNYTQIIKRFEEFTGSMSSKSTKKKVLYGDVLIKNKKKKKKETMKNLISNVSEVSTVDGDHIDIPRIVKSELQELIKDRTHVIVRTSKGKREIKIVIGRIYIKETTLDINTELNELYCV